MLDEDPNDAAFFRNPLTFDGEGEAMVSRTFER
jgi:hypothetical protein